MRKLLEKRRFLVTQSCWIISDLRSLSDLLEKIGIKTDHEFDILLSVRHDCGINWVGKKFVRVEIFCGNVIINWHLY